MTQNFSVRIKKLLFFPSLHNKCKVIRFIGSFAQSFRLNHNLHKVGVEKLCRANWRIRRCQLFHLQNANCRFRSKARYFVKFQTYILVTIENRNIDSDELRFLEFFNEILATQVQMSSFCLYFVNGLKCVARQVICRQNPFSF